MVTNVDNVGRGALPCPSVTSQQGRASTLRGALRHAGKLGALVPLWLASMALALTACASQPAAPQSQPTAAGQTQQLKVGVLPILDALPMYVAEQEGYFKAQQLQVELALFPSALERDSAFVAGQIDGELNDPVSTALLNKDGEKAKIVRLAMKGNSTMAMMVVLASPVSKIQSPKDLKGVPIGISRNSVIEYTTERLLQGAGLASNEIEKTEVTKIPVRTEMLAKGQLQAATLPEPLASLAIQQGARLVIDDSKTGTGQSVITFRQEVVSKNSDAVRRFLAAYEQGVKRIEAAPESYRDLLVDKAKVPDSLRNSLRMPAYPRAQLSTREELADVVSWMVERKLLDQPIPYEKLVAEGLLPQH
ncbi:MAG TPA: MetQ/NlpA family ABC transporter substrate-binding protein [Chloroflexota bacterium]|nr:MetQ/NlpA family ABC transporter substrate-binding protein [Chloroflexota bacterium]